MNHKTTLFIGAILGGLSVILGAFGAHALHPMLVEYGRVEIYEKAVHYQMFHAGGLLACGLFLKTAMPSQRSWAPVFFLLGVIFFCGSLYALAFTNASAWGHFAPIGGTSFVVGWVLFTYQISKKA